MAAKQEIQKGLKIALEEVGEIVPKYNKQFKMWLFSHPLYPVEYAGNSAEEVIENYQLYLREFIAHRLDGKLNPVTESETKGHGGCRKGAGRPLGTTKESTTRLSLPLDIAEWMREKSHWADIRKLIANEKKIMR